MASFLSVGRPFWDPSLALVMGAALALATPVFQWVMGRTKRGGAACAPSCTAQFDLPTRTAVDGRLLAGAALFGAGWGVGGVCPGPGLVAAAAGAGAPYAAWSAAFLAAHALTSVLAK